MRGSNTAVDQAALVALGVIGVGWFLLATLVVDFRFWQQGIHFYEVWAVIADPAGRLSGIKRSQQQATLAFALVCVAAILVPARSALYQRKDARLTYLIPLMLMTISCAVLYAKTSAGYIPAEVRPASASAWLGHLAQAAVARASDAVATRISIGAGAYLSMMGSAFLACAACSVCARPLRRLPLANNRTSSRSPNAGRARPSARGVCVKCLRSCRR